MAIILFEKNKNKNKNKTCVNHDANPSTEAHINIFYFKGHGSWVEFLAASCFVFVCLFVCLVFFSIPKVGDYFVFLSLTSGWGFLVFCFCFVLFFIQNVQFPHHNLGSGWFFFFFFFFFVSPVDKVFCFLLFLFVCLSLFYSVFLFCFCFQNFHPPWYQMVRPYPYSITQMMVDITSSTILNYRAIQWKI